MPSPGPRRPPATAGSSRVSPTASQRRLVAASRPTSPPARTCARQDDNDNGVGVISQNFEADFDNYDSRGADDFTLKRSCTVSEVDVNGAYFTGIGPAVSLHVTFYRDNGGTPGARVANQNDLDYRDPSGLGNFKIPLGRAGDVPARHVLGGGQGQHRLPGRRRVGLEHQQHGARQQRPVEERPGRLRHRAVRTYAEVLACLGDGGQGPDFSFALLK